MTSLENWLTTNNERATEPPQRAVGRPHYAPPTVQQPGVQPEPHESSGNRDVVFVTSFTDFYNLHYSKIASALAISLGSQELGKEACDEAMTRTFQRWGKVSGYANAPGWVYRVGLNWGLSWHRKAARRLPWIEASSTELPPTSDPALQDALKQLDPKLRSVVVCRYFLDWSTHQTAAALNIKEGTVKSRLSTALGRLKQQLEDDTVLS